MPHHAGKGMTAANQFYSLLDDEDDGDMPDLKEVAPVVAACPPYSLPLYSTSVAKSMHKPQSEQPRRKRGVQSHDMISHDGIGGAPASKYKSGGSHMPAVAAPATTSNLSMKQRDMSEYNYAQALLKQAPKLSKSTDLDKSSVLRLAQAFIELQHGLQSWKSSSNQVRWWPSNIDGEKLALATQETMSCFVLIITSKGKVVYVSEAVETLLGHNQLNLIGRSVESLVPRDELPVLSDQFSPISSYIRGGSAERSFYTRMLNVRRSGLQHQRFELVQAVGHIQEVLLTSGTFNNHDQKEKWLMCACRVMTPQLENEGSSSPCTEWISHNALNGTILYMDSRSCQVSGFLPKEVVGHSQYSYIHQDDQEYVAFSHNQALINVGGSSCTYRMYTHTQDIVFVHTLMQLARDKHTNRPKFLFCLHHLVEEHEGREQVAKHQQELMWVKPDPSIKFGMMEIERTVKALEMDGGNSPLVLSRGSMKTSILTDSCAADGGDLLSVSVGHHLQVPLLTVTKQEPGQGCVERYNQPSQVTSPNFPYSSSEGYYQQLRCQTPLSTTGQEYGTNYGFDKSAGRSQQQQQNMFHRQLSQQQMYTNVSPQYQQQMSLNDPSSAMLNRTTDSPGTSSNTGSFVDYLFDNSGPPSVPSDNQHMYGTDSLMNQNMISPTGRGRARSRTRGRPRGSGRGSRGAARGVRGTRGAGRARGGRGRGRGLGVQMSPSHDVAGCLRKSETMLSQSSLSPISVHGSVSPRSNLSPIAGGGELMFMNPDSGLNLPRSSSIGSNLMHHAGQQRLDTHQMSSGSETPCNLQPGNMSDLHHLHSNDMYQRMTSLEGLDMLEQGSDFSQPKSSNSMDMVSPRSWGSQDKTPSAQISPYRTVSGHESTPGTKRVGRPRGSKNQLERHQSFQRTMSIDESSASSLIGFRAGQQSSPYEPDSAYPGHSPSSTSYIGESARGYHNSSMGYSQLNIHSIHSSIRGHDILHRSLSFQSQTAGRLTSDTDPEHSILGNLLKGRGGSTSSAGSKSPAHTLLTNMGRSPGHSINQDRCGRSPVLQMTGCDRGRRSPAHSLISDAASPVSVFSPDSSRATPTVIKDEPEMSSVDDTCCMPSVFGNSPSLNSQLQQQQHDDVISFVLEQGEQKNMPEVQMFQAQPRHQQRPLEHAMISPEMVLRQLESSLQQPNVKDTSADALCAKINLLKANKENQKELRAMQAKLILETQHQQRQTQQLQQQHLGLQRHHLNSQTVGNTRRMAIVPPLQRQPTEVDMNSMLSQASPSELKGQSVGRLQQNSPDIIKQPPTPMTSPESTTHTSSALQLSGQQQNLRIANQENPIGPTSTFQSLSASHNGSQPQQSPFSLHHHHHHHHHYHHHSLPQKHSAYPSSIQEAPPPPPPPYGSYDSSVFSSSAVASAATSSTLCPGSALSISVSSTTASLASPIICDTSPVSVDESPSCSSDTSSGYHSLSHSADALANLCGAPFNKPHCLDMPASSSSSQSFGPKTPPGYEQMVKGTGPSPDMILSSAHISNK